MSYENRIICLMDMFNGSIILRPHLKPCRSCFFSLNLLYGIFTIFLSFLCEIK